MSAVVGPDALLVRRARYGDRRAARRLAARHLDRVALLAAAVGEDEQEAARLAREGFALALHAPGPFHQALLEAFAQLAGEAPDADRALGGLLVLLVDLEQRSLTEVAALLRLAPDDAERLLLQGRRSTSPSYPGRPCRGWPLVSRQGVTAAERRAGLEHLGLCRRCRERRDALEESRRRLLGRAGGVAGLVAVGELAVTAMPTAAGVATVVAGKAGVAAVTALGAVVLATGTAVVATSNPPRHVPPQRTPVVPVATSPAHRAPASGAPTARCTACTPAPVPSAVPTASRRPAAPVLPAAPTSPLPLPTVPLPTVPGLPLPLPTTLPVVPLPTTLLPLPTTLLPLPTAP